MHAQMPQHMHDQLNNIEELEFAERDQPACSRCGMPTRLVAEGDVIALECIDHSSAPLLRRILTMEFGHTRIVLGDLSFIAA